MNWREEYPYISVDRERHFDDDKFAFGDGMPPSLQGRSIEMKDVYFAIQDLKRAGCNKCRKGRRLNALKISQDDFISLLNELQDLLYQKSA